MARDIKLFEKLGIIQNGEQDPDKAISIFEGEFGLVLSKRAREPVKIENMSMEEVLEKYRKNTSAAMVNPVVRIMDKHRFEKPIFMLKHYRDSSERNFGEDVQLMYLLYNTFEQELRDINEHRFTGVANARRKIPAFLRPWSYGNDYFAQKKIIITDFSQDFPFNKRFEGDKKHTFWGFTSALDLPVLLHDHIPRFENQIPQLKEILSHPLSLEDYSRSFSLILETAANIPTDQRAEMKARFENLVKTYLLPPEFSTLIQYDGYPWHNDTNYFLDIGKLRMGSRGMHLGALLGHPDIFSKMENPEDTLKVLLIDTYDKFKRYEVNVQFPAGPFSSLDEKILENGFYVGAICANANVLVEQAAKLSDDEVSRLEATIRQQFEILQKKDLTGSARKFTECTPMNEWNYRPNLIERVTYLEKLRSEKK